MHDSTPADAAQLLDVARRAAEGAGTVLMQYLREGVAMRSKEHTGGVPYELVSDADLEAERLIARIIADAFPRHELLGEEALQHGSVDAEHLWVIDPLDGTNNFAHRLPHFAVSIAYYRDGRPQVGVIFNPARDDWYTAVAGQGAHCNGRRAVVSPATRLNDALIGCGFYYDRGDMMRRTLAAIGDLFESHIHGIRRFGTASLDLCSVGCGQFGGFFEYQLSPWDFAAGRLFVQEAGGRVTDARGLPLPMTKTSLLASNGALHEAILAITARHHPQA